MDEINLMLQEAAEEQREERLEVDYEAFLEEMYYWLECSQWERDMELYNELW
jgi:hypothetical protein